MSAMPYETLKKTLSTYEVRHSFYKIMFETVVAVEQAKNEDVYEIIGSSIQLLTGAPCVLCFSKNEELLELESISEYSVFDANQIDNLDNHSIFCSEKDFQAITYHSVYKYEGKTNKRISLLEKIYVTYREILDSYSGDEYLININNAGHSLGVVFLKFHSEQSLEHLEMIKLFVYLMSVMLARNIDKENLKRMFDDIHLAHSELKEAQTQLVHSEKLASIGQLSAGIAHEINNPLGYVKSNVVTLRKYFERYMEFVDECSEHVEQKESLSDFQEQFNELRNSKKLNMIKSNMSSLTEDIEDGLDRIRKIVLDLKLFARSDTVDSIQEININEVFDSVLSIVWNEVKYKAELVKELKDVPPIKATAQKLGQVFINLIVNAAHAIEEKGTIIVRTYSDQDYVYADVEDDGAGIHEDVREKIFEPFFTTKEAGKGTGMGLSISSDIIRKLGGELILRSEIGVGSVFTIKIPVVQVGGE